MLNTICLEFHVSSCIHSEFTAATCWAEPARGVGWATPWAPWQQPGGWASIPDPHHPQTLPTGAALTSSGPTWTQSSCWRSWAPLPPLRASGSCSTRHRWARPTWGGPVCTLTTSTAHLVPLTITAGRWVPARSAGERLFPSLSPRVPLFLERADCSMLCPVLPGPCYPVHTALDT